MPYEELSQLFKLLDTLPNPVTLNELCLDEDGEPYDKIIYVNKNFLENIGYTTEDIPTDRVWFTKAYPDPEYQQYVSNEWFKAVKKAQDAKTDLNGFPAQVTCKNGQKEWFNITTQLDHPISQNYRTIIFVKTDAPEKTKLELDQKSLELIRHELLLQTIIDTLPIRIYWKDKAGVYLGCNQAFLDDAQLIHIDEVKGKTDNDMPWREDAECFRRDDEEVFNTQSPKLNYIQKRLLENGEEHVLSISKVILRNAQGELLGILGSYEDITQEYQNELKVKEHEKMMIIQSRQAAMGEMLSMITHQWKQPLNSISTIVANIRIRGSLNTYDFNELDLHSQEIENQVKYLTQTISDFSNFFKPDKGKERSHVCAPVQKALLIIDKQLENNEISISFDCHETRSMFTYPKKLQQVCINIINNASDALVETAKKDARIEIKVTSDEESAYYSFSDNAGGIKQDVIDKIFDPYFSTKSEEKGTGLGLYMSKTIVENHLNGTLSCENIEDGARFMIKIPLVIS
jgi:PAS domain S-box-containing protein